VPPLPVKLFGAEAGLVSAQPRPPSGLLLLPRLLRLKGAARTDEQKESSDVLRRQITKRENTNEGNRVDDYCRRYRLRVFSGSALAAGKTIHCGTSKDCPSSMQCSTKGVCVSAQAKKKSFYY